MRTIQVLDSHKKSKHQNSVVLKDSGSDGNEI